MAIIMRSNGQTRDQGDKRKQLYTWVGCGMVIVLTLISVIPNMGSEQKEPDYSKFSSSRMQDLAAMPFGTDGEAGSFLRGNPEYAEISNADLLGSLFSSEDRQERQAQDKAEGVPPPPDPEYREIAKQKSKEEETKMIREARLQRQVKKKEERDRILSKERERASRITRNQNTKQTQQIRNQNQNTRQSLSSSGRSGFSGGGSSGVTGSIWRYEGKDIKANNAGSSAISNHTTTAQDIAFAKDKGRSVGLDVAAIESMKGANAETADAAAAGAIDAFQGEVAAEDLAKDEQELGFDELPQAINEDLQDELKRTLGDDINKQTSNSLKSSGTANGKEYSVNENCMDTNGNFVTSCAWHNFWTNLGNTVIQSGFNCITSGCWTKWKKDRYIIVGDKIFDTEDRKYIQ